MGPLTQHVASTTTALDFYIDNFRHTLANQSTSFQVLCEVLDVTLVANRPLALGSVLSFLGDSRSIALLREWSQHSRDSELLANLGETLSELSLSTQLLPLSESKPSREHFFGGLEDFYLIALLAERLPPEQTDPQGWM